MSGLEQYLHPIPEAGNKSLHEAVRKLAGKAGIEMPMLYKPKPGHPIFDMMPVAAFETEGKSGGIILNEKMFRRAFDQGGRISGNARISDEVQGLIAHEMGHIKRGDIKTFGMARVSTFTPLACMAGAMVGLHMVRRYLKKHKEPMPMQEAEDQTKIPEQIKSPTLEMAKRVALYTVAGAAGLTAGVFMARGMRHHMEYSCDAFSKEVMGSGKPLASALEKFGQYFHKVEESVLRQYPEEKRESLRQFFRMIEGLFHPPIAQRIEHLR